MTDQQAEFSADQFLELQESLARFLDENCSSYCLDTDEDREEVSGRIAHWMVRQKVVEASPEKLLPKAQYRLGFNVVDEQTGERIIRLTLTRSSQMTDGDFMQMQNFFWCTVGRAIRDNPEIIKTLQLGGIDVDVDPGVAGGQLSPT
jgi:hypothetical protein